MTESSFVGTLPKGITAIEASAGTGKTYALASLVVRFIAETDTKIDEILVVTFTRAATAELVDRVRRRLAESAVALRLPPGTHIDDRDLAVLASTDRVRRLARVEKALTNFDAATITTIHGFAQLGLGSLGSTGPFNADAQLIEDSKSFAAAVSADVLAAAALGEPLEGTKLPDLESLANLVSKALGNPEIVLVPSGEPEDSNEQAAMIRRLVDKTLKVTRERRAGAGTLSYDELLTELRGVIRAGGGPVASLQRRYNVALIDEFQDTDPVQWEIFRDLFKERLDGPALVLVGDPKQAVYSFRGANVHTYLKARDEDISGYETLGTNWRSDGALIDVLNELFDGVTFGHEDIKYLPVEASPENEHKRIKCTDGTALPVLRLRAALDDTLERGNGRPPRISTDDALDAIAADLAEQVQHLLEVAQIPDARHVDGSRRVRPGDIAVVVRMNRQSPAFRDALKRRSIPALILGGEKLMESVAAMQWKWLLIALGRPNDLARIRAAAMSWFFGLPANQIADLDEAEFERIQATLAAWARTLVKQGVVAFCAQVWAESNVTARVLSMADGDRNITDLDQIAGLLQDDSTGRVVGAAGLLAALDRIEIEAKLSSDKDFAARRIESESEAVQIMTVHSAKGLEFPIVCVPTMWNNALGAQNLDVIYQDPVSKKRTFDVAPKAAWPSTNEAKRRKGWAEDEILDENLRLLYVALTRAKHQTLVWWSTTTRGQNNGLAKVLWGRIDGVINVERFKDPTKYLPENAAGFKEVELIFKDNQGRVDFGVFGAPKKSIKPWVDDAAPEAPTNLAVSELRHVPNRSPRRWSFTAISKRRSLEQHSESEFEPDENVGDAGANDEPIDIDEFVAQRELGAPATSPLLGVRGGKVFGNLVHSVLEHVDFATPDIEGDLEIAIERALRWNPWPVAPATLIAGLRTALETPLGALFNDRPLRSFGNADRLNELKFELRLADSGRPATLRDIGSLLLRHLPETDSMRSWAHGIAHGEIEASLSGHLTGSIDLILRVTDSNDPGARPRFIVSDYKTNTLPMLGATPELTDYHPDQLSLAMGHHDYALQALLYSVALHRYLRWRLPDYDPSINLGGIAYFFVRGMGGANAPLVGGCPNGVFIWRPTAALITELSELLDGKGSSR